MAPSTVIRTNDPPRKEIPMFAKTLIAAAALTAVTAGMASTAQAKVNFDVHVGVPGIYVGPGYGYFPAYYDDDYYGGDCFTKKVKKVKWHDHGGFMHKHVSWKNKLVCY
jgi:hypothetical protein